MTKINKYIFITLISLLFFSEKAFSQERLISLKKTENKITSFIDQTFSNGKDTFQFKFDSNNKVKIRIEYAFIPFINKDELRKSSRKEIYKGVLEKEESFYFPSSQKFIELTEEGIHKFTVLLDNGKSYKSVIYVENPHKSYLSADALINMKPNNPSGWNNIKGDAKDYKMMSMSSYAQSSFDIENIKQISSKRFRNIGTSLYKNVSPSVVLISGKQGIGSGTYIDKKGLILTNWHVIKGQEVVKVLFKPETFKPISSVENYVADVINFDKNSDLALLKLRSNPSNISEIKFASLNDIDVAMEVHAIGHPKGNFWTYTKGVISQIRPNYKWKTSKSFSHNADILQTQTPINPGNSGGPLLNNNMEIVGINTFIDQQASGLNYAVATSTIKKFLDTKVVKKRKIKNENNVYIPIEVDLDKNGTNETKVYDRNENGIPELIERDKNNDGIPDIIYIDKNENRVFEIKIKILVSQNKVIGIWEFDKNEDKKIDALGYDYNLDGKIDKYEKV